MKPFISFILLAENQGHKLLQMLASIDYAINLQGMAACEIIVVDNASRDHSKQLLKTLEKPIKNLRTIFNAEKLPLKSVAELGFLGSRGEWQVFVPCVPSSLTAKHIVDFAERLKTINDDVLICVSRVKRALSPILINIVSRQILQIPFVDLVTDWVAFREYVGDAVFPALLPEVQSLGTAILAQSRASGFSYTTIHMDLSVQEGALRQGRNLQTIRELGKIREWMKQRQPIIPAALEEKSQGEFIETVYKTSKIKTETPKPPPHGLLRNAKTSRRSPRRARGSKDRQKN